MVLAAGEQAAMVDTMWKELHKKGDGMSDINVLVVQEPGRIELNISDLKNAVSEIVSSYNGVIVTEDTIPNAKKDLASLRKIKGELEDRRKSAKKLWMKPYEEFEKQVKEVTALVETPIEEIDSQLKEFEQDRVNKRQEELKELYKANVGEYAEYLPYEKLFKPQWLNKSSKDQDVIFSIQEDVAKVSSDLAVILSLKSEVQDKCIAQYKASGNNLAVAVKVNTDYLEAKEIAEKKLQEEQERKAKEEAEKAAREAEARAKEESDREAKEAAQKAKEQAEKQWFEASKSEIEAVPVMEIPKDDFINEPEMIFKVVGADAITQIQNFLELSEIRYEVM